MRRRRQRAGDGRERHEEEDSRPKNYGSTVMNESAHAART
jgi:hypothetical protein